MHGLVNRALQGFLTDTYGDGLWQEVVSQADLPAEGFESMLQYEDRLTEATIEAAIGLLHRDRPSLLEDLGTYLVSHPNQEGLRRLMRFGGDTFFDFLISLDDLAARARLAVPDLDPPELEVSQSGRSNFNVRVTWRLSGIGHVFLGAVRAMADDYGALAIFDIYPSDGKTECLKVELLDMSFASGRSFVLGESRA